jgi:hypothetical protein
VWRSCPVCGCKEVEILYSYKRIQYSGSIFPGEGNIVSCKRCGFVYEDSALTQDKLNEYYKKLYANNTENRMETSLDDSFESKRAGFQYAVNYAKKYYQSQDPIMDIGCDQGVFLQLLLNEGFQNLSGMETRKGNLQKLKSLGIKAIEASITEPIFGFNSKRFEIITLFTL